MSSDRRSCFRGLDDFLLKSYSHPTNYYSLPTTFRQAELLQRPLDDFLPTSYSLPTHFLLPSDRRSCFRGLRRARASRAGGPGSSRPQLAVLRSSWHLDGRGLASRPPLDLGQPKPAPNPAATPPLALPLTSAPNPSSVRPPCRPPNPSPNPNPTRSPDPNPYQASRPCPHCCSQ